LTCLAHWAKKLPLYTLAHLLFNFTLLTSTLLLSWPPLLTELLPYLILPPLPLLLLQNEMEFIT
ncbi:unnamed protein product, partial (mitochondrion) [Musa textilis]